MSVAYEPRSFHDDSSYAPVGENDHDHTDLNKYINTEANVDDMADLAAATYEPTADAPSPFDPSDSPGLDLGPVAPPNVDPANVPIREISPAITTATSPVLAASTRSKPIAKPNRIVTKNEDGQFECKWSNCTEETKTFQRKCEWSKHMDKHERPYVCTVKGCEKVQGFTYSGGLLRHEREVHGKHGGPKKALNCPHANCKRNAGKGFSRLENLQEHLRRVHTSASASASAHPHSPAETTHDDDSASDVASAAFAVMSGIAASPGDTSTTTVLGVSGSKRQRCLDDVGDRGSAAQEEIARLREDNDELRRQLQEQMRLTSDMRAQLQAMQAAISQTLAVPQPPVL